MLKKIIVVLVITFNTSNTFSQSKKDIIFNQEIFDLLISNDKNDYVKAKNLFTNLQKKNGYLPEYVYRFLGSSYKNNDMVFFKKNLIILTQDYGFDLSLLDKRATYYESLTTGKLADWFKNIYPKSRAIWLKNNYDKIPYLHELNNFATKDQIFVKFASKLNNELKLKNEEKFILDSLIIDQNKKNFDEFICFVDEIGGYPTAGYFTLNQTPFYLIQTHTLKIPDLALDNLSRIYPYWERAYLNGEIDYVPFYNFDSQLFVATGKQYFGLLKTEDFSEYILSRKGLTLKDSIPVLDQENLKIRRQKLNWD